MDISTTRSCNGCTKCCEGWLFGEAHGNKFWPGRPCHYKSCNGCSVYESRPEDPCKIFQCEWLINDKIPEWMKPDQSNVIIYKRMENDIEYLEVTEAGARLDTGVLSWLFIEYANGNIDNVKYQLDSGWNYIWRNHK